MYVVLCTAVQRWLTASQVHNPPHSVPLSLHSTVHGHIFVVFFAHERVIVAHEPLLKHSFRTGLSENIHVGITSRAGYAAVVYICVIVGAILNSSAKENK